MAVKAGDPIPITLQVSDDDTGVFPRAVVYDNAGTPIAGSPVALSHIASGFYRNQALVMPATPRVFVQLKVYQDSGFTIRHPIHSDTLLDVIERDTILEALDNFSTTVKGDITGFVDDSELSLEGSLVDDSGLLGEILDDGGLIGFATAEDLLVGILSDAGELTGMAIDC